MKHVDLLIESVLRHLSKVDRLPFMIIQVSNAVGIVKGLHRSFFHYSRP